MIQKRVTYKTVIFEVWELRNAPKVAQGAKTAPKRTLKVKVNGPFFETFFETLLKRSLREHPERSKAPKSTRNAVTTSENQYRNTPDCFQVGSQIKKMASAPPMQRTVFLAMLETPCQVASLTQIAGTCVSSAQKSNHKFGGSFPHAE